MQVDIFRDYVAGDEAVQFRVIDPLFDVPNWMQVTIGPSDRPFLTDPPHHYFEDSAARMSPPRAILMTAREYARGDIDKPTAERQLHTALTKWAEIKERDERNRGSGVGTEDD